MPAISIRSPVPAGPADGPFPPWSTGDDVPRVDGSSAPGLAAPLSAVFSVVGFVLLVSIIAHRWVKLRNRRGEPDRSERRQRRRPRALSFGSGLNGVAPPPPYSADVPPPPFDASESSPPRPPPAVVVARHVPGSHRHGANLHDDVSEGDGELDEEAIELLENASPAEEGGEGCGGDAGPAAELVHTQLGGLS